jgi:hypothetical protein
LFSLINLKNISMKKFKYLLIAVATFGLSSLFSCSGSSDKETNQDSIVEEVSSEPVIEETQDTIAKIDSTAKTVKPVKSVK